MNSAAAKAVAAKAPLDVKRIRADFPILGIEVSGKPLVYLDNAASSQMPQPVIDRVHQAIVTSLKDPAIRQKIIDDTNTHGAESGGSRKRTLCKNGDWHKIWLASGTRNANLVGQDFRAIAAARGAGRKVAFTVSESFVIARHGDDFRAMIDAGEPLTQTWIDAGTWTVEIADHHHPATVSLRPLYDPRNERIEK